MQRKQLLWLIVLGFMARALMYFLVVPIWEFPDEQAHYSQIAYYMEIGPKQPGFDVSLETLLWQQALGTVRDNRGINNYTYNPGFRPEYSSEAFADGERELRALPDSTRTTLVKSEAAWYPPLYYRLISPAYGLTQNLPLPERILALRVLSSIMFLLMGVAVYLASKRVFADRFWPIVALFWIWFHPMLSFVMHGINNDVLLNLTSAGAIAMLIYQLRDGPTRLSSFVMAVCLGLAILTKPLGIPLAVAVMSVVILEWVVSRRSWRLQWQSWRWPLLILLILGGSYLGFKAYQAGGVPFLAGAHPDNPLRNLSVLEYAKTQLPQHYRQTLVWYWGVYKWLGVILPLWLIRILKLAMILSALGLVLRFWRHKQDRLLIVGLLAVSLVYFLTLSWWDFDMIRRVGFSHGLQGRYFFPTILAHVLLLAMGWKQLLSKLPFAAWLVGFSGLGAWLISIHTLLKSYYQLDDLRVFLVQLSQYKPLIFKPPFQLFWLLVSVLGLGILVYGLIQLSQRKDVDESSKPG